ncbi:MAG: hypothetical protein FWC41_03480, partial [Firmicutes bacterium]|nr:hypothetical protein [Bacillota bacterium]
LLQEAKAANDLLGYISLSAAISNENGNKEKLNRIVNIENYYNEQLSLIETINQKLINDVNAGRRPDVMPEPHSERIAQLEQEVWKMMDDENNTSPIIVNNNNYYLIEPTEKPTIEQYNGCLASFTEAIFAYEEAKEENEKKEIINRIISLYPEHRHEKIKNELVKLNTLAELKVTYKRLLEKHEKYLETQQQSIIVSSTIIKDDNIEPVNEIMVDNDTHHLEAHQEKTTIIKEESIEPDEKIMVVNDTHHTEQVNEISTIIEDDKFEPDEKIMVDKVELTTVSDEYDHKAYRHTEETKEKIRKALKAFHADRTNPRWIAWHNSIKAYHERKRIEKRNKTKTHEKTCKFCGNIFTTNEKYRVTCPDKKGRCLRKYFFKHGHSKIKTASKEVMDASYKKRILKNIGKVIEFDDDFRKLLLDKEYRKESTISKNSWSIFDDKVKKAKEAKIIPLRFGMNKQTIKKYFGKGTNFIQEVQLYINNKER